MKMVDHHVNEIQITVKLGFNELGYNELPLIANQFKFLVGFQYFVHLFSWLKANITNKNKDFSLLSIFLFFIQWNLNKETKSTASSLNKNVFK